MTPCTRFASVAALSLVALSLSAGCAFVEDATDVVIGADSGLPRIETSATIDVGQVNGALLLAVREATGSSAAGEAWLLPDDASWAELRDALCGLWSQELLATPGLDVRVIRGGFGEAENDPTLDAIKSATMRLEVPVDDLGVSYGGLGRCLAGSLVGELRVEFVPFAVGDLDALSKQLDGKMDIVGEAITQIRFEISRFDFVRPSTQGAEGAKADDGDKVGEPADPAFPDGTVEVINDALKDFQLALLEPDIVDDPRTAFDDGLLELVPFFLLDTISAETPQRFELDPDSPVTRKVHGILDQPPETWAEASMTIQTRVELGGDALYETPLDGAGVALSAQAEVVVDGLVVFGL